MNSIKLYNTMTGKKELLIPKEEGRINMYVCGPTTYNYIHLGNGRPIVVFDTIRRFLEFKGFQVVYIQNFTDVDDKIINRAKEQGEEPLVLAQKFIEEYFKDADALNVKRATVHPKVSEHMQEIIDFIKGLIEKGFAYALENDVYFAVRKFSEYGKLSNRSLDDLQAGARVGIDIRKQDAMDFALWKGAKEGEISWDSPWGKGRPGWHIECSAMSFKYLGSDFDIHGGGYDLVFPHHENEIAQTESLLNKPMARYWLHNGFITVNQEKMSKSLGNFFLLRDIFAKFQPQVVRFYLLSTHYRSPLDFDDEKLLVAKKGLDRLWNAVSSIDEVLKIDTKSEDAGVSSLDLIDAIEEARKDFTNAMSDDFNTALAIASLFNLARDINSFVKKVDIKEKGTQNTLLLAKQTMLDLLDVLGIEPYETEDHSSQMVDKLMELIIGMRQHARSKKDFAMADKIRDELKEIGIILEDAPTGTKWKNI